MSTMPRKPFVPRPPYPRIRSDDGRNTGNCVLTVRGYDRVGGGSNPLVWYDLGTSTWNNLRSGTYRSMSDVVTPGYRNLSDEGRVFMNPMGKVEYTLVDGGGSNGELVSTTLAGSAPYQYYPRRAHIFTGTVSPGLLTSSFSYPVLYNGMLQQLTPLFPASELSSLRTQVMTECLNNVGRGDSNLWETIAEADKALGTLTGLFKSLLKLLIGLYATKPKGFWAVPANASAMYLATRYGIMPIVNDIKSVLASLEKALGSIRQTYRASGQLQRSDQVVNNNYGLAAAYTCRQQWDHQSFYRIRAMSLYEYQASVASNLGLTAKGLLTLPWELVPFSFVVDWFVNVGSYIGSLVPFFNASHLGSCLVEEHTVVTNYSFAATSCTAGYSIVSRPSGVAQRNYVSKDRTRQDLKSGLVLKYDFRFSNILRALDSVALVVQQFSKVVYR